MLTSVDDFKEKFDGRSSKTYLAFWLRLQAAGAKFVRGFALAQLSFILIAN